MIQIPIIIWCKMRYLPVTMYVRNEGVGFSITHFKQNKMMEPSSKARYRTAVSSPLKQNTSLYKKIISLNSFSKLITPCCTKVMDTSILTLLLCITPGKLFDQNSTPPSIDACLDNIQGI